MIIDWFFSLLIDSEPILWYDYVLEKKMEQKSSYLVKSEKVKFIKS